MRAQVRIRVRRLRTYERAFTFIYHIVDFDADTLSILMYDVNLYLLIVYLCI